MKDANVKPDLGKMEALIDEMSITIRNLSALATAHGLMNPYANRHLHDAIDGDLTAKPVEETLDLLKKINEEANPEWSFLNVG